jgi:hypothetical protein
MGGSGRFSFCGESGKILATAQKDSLQMCYLSSHEALQLTATFAVTAERMRADVEAQTLAGLYERASRVAFLKAHLIARKEEVRPIFGQNFRRAGYAAA